MNRLIGKIENNKDKILDYSTEYLNDADVVIFSCSLPPAQGLLD